MYAKADTQRFFAQAEGSVDALSHKLSFSVHELDSVSLEVCRGDDRFVREIVNDKKRCNSQELE